MAPARHRDGGAPRRGPGARAFPATDALDLQILATLALGEQPGQSVPGLAALLATDQDAIEAALRRVAGDRLVESPDPNPETEPDERLWLVTGAGRRRVETWLARIAPLFARWPPDRPDVDDATL